MNNVEKRLQIKVRREEASEKRKQERKQKKIEIGTKKIFYTILKNIVNNKRDRIAVWFNEFIDSNTSASFLSHLRINGKEVFLGKTYFDFDKLQTHLKAYDFNIQKTNRSYHQPHLTPIEKIFFQDHSHPGKIEIYGIRSQVCHKLLTLPSQNEKENPSLNNDGPTLTKK